MLDFRNILTATAVTTDQTCGPFVNAKGKGILISIVVSSAGTGEITDVEIHALQADGTYALTHTLAPTSAIASNGTYQLVLYPIASYNSTALAGTAVVGVLPGKFKIVIDHGNSNAMTYKVSYQVLA